MFDFKSVTPPGIALVLSFLFLYWGILGDNAMLKNAGWIFLAVAVFLQLTYLLARYRTNSKRPGFKTSLNSLTISQEDMEKPE